MAQQATVQTKLRKEDIINLLSCNDRAICRALVVLKNRQTADEIQSQHTSHDNGRGFTGFDGMIGTSMAQFYEKTGFLTPKQLAYWKKPMKNGVPRIGKYWKQLIEEACAKAERKEVVVSVPSIPSEPEETVSVSDFSKQWRNKCVCK